MRITEKWQGTEKAFLNTKRQAVSQFFGTVRFEV